MSSALPLLWLAGCTPLPDAAAQPSPPPPLPSIVLISLDTLRADRVGAYSGPAGLTPNLDRLAAEGVVFREVYSQASETLFSHASLLTGRYPSELGPLSYALPFPDAGLETLAEVLRLYGYDTGAAVGGIHMTAAYGFDQGFDAFLQPTHEAGSLYHTLPAALSWLDQRPHPDRPFFLLLHSYDTHARYLKPTPFGYAFTDPRYNGVGHQVARSKEGTSHVLDHQFLPQASLESLLSPPPLRLYDANGAWNLPPQWERTPRRPLTPADQEHIAATYDGAVAYADAWVGRTMAALQERGLLDHTLVVVLSDHGEHLGEQGVYAHRYFLDDTSLQVPLLVRLPGGHQGGRVVEGLFELTDVLPTLLDAAGATTPAGTHGHSLWPVLTGTGPAPQRTHAFSEGMFRMLSARSATGRLTITGLSVDSPFLPAILEDLPLDSPAVLSSGAISEADRAALLAWREALRPLEGGVRTPVSAELLESLRREGYWGGDPP